MRRRLLTLLLLLCLLFGLSTAVFATEAFPATAGSTLTGLDKIIYDRLSEEIQKVASGETSLTYFDITLEELGLTDSWTAADLGIDALIEGSSISAAAVNALTKKLQYNIQPIAYALLADHPYALYWYDKTIGILSESQLSIGASYDYATQQWLIYFKLDAYLTFALAVSKEYASGLTATMQAGSCFCEVDLQKRDSFRVDEALAEARAIVQANEAKSDYEKLAAYRDAICAAVSYHHTAAETEDYPYGNPWQLISVFDGDPGTNVVCEGYAKAFKYLCDLTDFEGDIHCYLVDGWSDGGTGAGAHMWNLVVMPDGESYVVDVTNCDENTLGYPHWLFLAGDDNNGASSADYVIVIPEHDLGNGSLGGQIAYLYNDATCGLWDERILDIADSDYVPGEDDGKDEEDTPHTHFIVPDAAVAPTCTADGLTEGSHCLTCGEVLVVQETVPATGHSYDAGTAAFTWNGDFSDCKASVTCTAGDHTRQLGGHITRTQSADGRSITLTAAFLLDGVPFSTETVIRAEGDSLVLPAAAKELQLLIVGFETSGRLVSCQMTETEDSTVDLSGIEGDRILVFFLKDNAWTPVLPSLLAK